jgi:hypothetical protein
MAQVDPIVVFTVGNITVSGIRLFSKAFETDGDRTRAPSGSLDGDCGSVPTDSGSNK